MQPGAHEHETSLDTRTTLLILACLLSLTGAGQAGPVDLGDRVAGAPGVTYFDLMKQVVTDLDSDQAETKAHQIVELPAYRRQGRQDRPCRSGRGQ